MVLDGEVWVSVAFRYKKPFPSGSGGVSSLRGYEE